jgi:hypothetical protein
MYKHDILHGCRKACDPITQVVSKYGL